MAASPDEDASPPAAGEATLILRALSRGDEVASEQLLRIVYGELRNLADAFLRKEREGHTLQPTALIHEAWLRIAGQEEDWQNRGHFLGVASLAMRRVLVDHARRRAREKRGGGAQREELRTQFPGDLGPDIDVIDLHEGLEQLAQHSERSAKVVELRFFAGLTEDEVAEVLGVTRATVTRDWRAARAWLSSWLKSERG
jgi:RNA polymerase sigma factor (TIGR02999 family)